MDKALFSFVEKAMALWYNICINENRGTYA
jgi:hypothetical protein